MSIAAEYPLGCGCLRLQPYWSSLLFAYDKGRPRSEIKIGATRKYRAAVELATTAETLRIAEEYDGGMARDDIHITVVDQIRSSQFDSIRSDPRSDLIQSDPTLQP